MIMSEVKEPIVHFTSELFTAELEGIGTRACKAVIIEDRGCIGVGIQWEYTGEIWYSAATLPSDPFAAFRGTEILRQCSKLTGLMRGCAYWAGVRDQNGIFPFAMEGVELLVTHIGKETYDAIMAMKIPEEVVDYTIDCLRRGVSIAQSWITDEVRAGTVEWRDVFADFGVEHPSVVDAREQRNEEIRTQHQEALKSLIDFVNASHVVPGSDGISIGCNVYNYIEATIVTAAGDRNAESELDMRTITALGYVVGSVACTESTHAYRSCNKEARLKLWRKEFEETIFDAALWLSADGKQYFDGLYEVVNAQVLRLRELIIKYFPEGKDKIPH